MIRYYPVDGDPNRLRVTARRKTRGYVHRASEAVAVYDHPSNLEASVSWQVVDGWRPIGLNGVHGDVAHTRRQAAFALVSEQRFR